MNGYPGTLTVKKYGGSLRAECFKYKGGKLAYEIKRNTKAAAGLVVLSPDKKVFAKFTGEFSFNYRGYHGGMFLKDNGNLDFTTLEPRNANRSIEVYGRDFEPLKVGKVENNQRVGYWIEKGKRTWYMQGVEVSQKLHDAEPDQIDPQEVLNMENAQLRAALIGKIGMERIIQKLKGTIID